MDEPSCSTANTSTPVPPTAANPVQLAAEDPEPRSKQPSRRHPKRASLTGALPPSSASAPQQRPGHQRRSLSSQSTFTHRHRRQAASLQHQVSPVTPQRTLQDMQNEQSYLLQHLQRHDERARTLMAGLADAQDLLLQSDSTAAATAAVREHNGKRRGAQKEVRLLRNKLMYNEQQERATLGRLGDLYVEMQARERWCCVLQQQHQQQQQQQGMFARDTVVEMTGWPLASPLGWVCEGWPVLLSPSSPGMDAVPLTPLSPLSPCFVPGMYFDEEVREEDVGQGKDAGGEFANEQRSDEDDGQLPTDQIVPEDIEQAAPVKGRARSLSLSTPSPEPPSRRLSLQF